MFTLTIKDEVTPHFKAILKSLGTSLAARKEVNTIVGQAAAQLTRDHLYALANTRHRPGVGQNFYEDAGDSVTWQDLGGGVELRMDKTGLAQRFHGGTIKPVKAKKLWIPKAGTEAEGRVPGEFNIKDFSIRISALTGKGVAMKGDDVLFYLVKEVTQDPDPSVLPSESEYQTSALDTLSQFAARALERASKEKGAQPGRDERGRFLAKGAS